MKGIVIDVKHKDAVILSDDGLFKKIKNKNYEIGQILQLTESMESTSNHPILGSWKAGSRLVAGAASIAAVMVIGTIGAFAYYTPTDYVSMDVNPSIEYSINMFDRILDAKAVNEDGEEILSDLALKNRDIEEALRKTLAQLISEGYLEDDADSGVVIATSNDELVKAEKLAKELEQDVRTYLVTQEGVTAKVEAKAVSPEKVKEAENLGVSAGKLCLVEKLQASTDSAIDRDKWLAMPVKDINKAIKENRGKAGTNPGKQDRNVIQSPVSESAVVIPGLAQNQEKKQNRHQYPGWRAKGSSETGIVNNGQGKAPNQGIRNWNQHKIQAQDQSQNQGKTQLKNWNQHQNQKQNKNEDQDRNQKQNKNEDQDQDQKQNKNKDQNRDQTSNQAIRNGGWHNGWNDSNDADQSNGGKQSGSRKNSSDR